MTDIGRRAFIKGSAAVGFTLSGRGAFAQDSAANWPNRAIKFIAPFAAGGGIDFTARSLGEFMSRHVQQPVVVENRTGAGSTIGMDMVMKSAPDGYTVLIASDNAASAPHVLKLSYDYTHEMEPVIRLAWQPHVLAVHSSINVKSVPELIQYARANPGLGFATSGAGGNQHIFGEWFKKEAGIPIVHVPYRGSGQAINDLVAGHVKIAFIGPTTLIPHYRAGTLRLLAVSSGKRTTSLPEIPTFPDLGFKNLILESWYAAFVAKGTSQAIVNRLNAEFVKALSDPTIRGNFAKAAVEIVEAGTPGELRTIAQADSAKYKRLITELNIKIE